MTAEIISVGTELLLGNILNTNAQYLSRELAALGITVQRESTIGDNHSRLADFVNEAKQRCDLLVFTGGLGPTADDLTKETVASCYGDTLAFDAEEWNKIVAYFTRTGRTVTPNNRKQAMVPVHGRKVVNRHGTAPGAWFEQDGRCAVLMPGVPHEMKAMWQEEVRPLLLARQNCALHSLTLRVLGGESNLEYQVRDLLENANPTAAIYCKTGECEIRITARAKTDTEAETMCRAYAKKFYDLLGDAVYDEDVAGLEETVVHTLQRKGLTLATAESCTGGMIAQRITNVSGASEVFGYGFVTYWEQAKEKLVGVDPAVIEQYNEAIAKQQENDRLVQSLQQVQNLTDALATYPTVDSALMAKISAAGGEQVSMVLTGWDATTGALQFNAQSSNVIDIPSYVLALQKTGLFRKVDYTGYAYDEGVYVLSLNCILQGEEGAQ